jgi:Leucine-rich repeat (LRR) protein
MNDSFPVSKSFLCKHPFNNDQIRKHPVSQFRSTLISFLRLNFAVPSYLLIIFCLVFEANSAIYDCKCNGDVCQMVQEAVAGKDCHSTNTNSLTLPADLFNPVQQRVELLVKNLNLKSTSGVFQNTSEAMTKIVSIDLSDNQMTVIQTNEFLAVVNVTILNIGNNQLSVIQDNAFSGLIKLTKLILWVNHISKLPGNLLCKLPNLVELNLHSNRFREFDVCVFMHAKALELLFLESNDIQIIQNCPGESGVKKLFLHKNRLTDIEDLKRFPKLNTLNLGSNPSLRLTQKSFFRWHALEYLTIDNIDLTGSVKFSESLQDVAPTLRELSLSNNGLEEFTVADFPQLSQLVTLRIEDNRLAQFDYELLRPKFPIIGQIAITGNRWECGYLKGMVGDFKKRGIKLLNVPPPTDDIVNVDGVTCIAGNDRANIYVIVLIALGAVIAVIAICLFFVQIYLFRNQNGQTFEQRSFEVRIQNFYRGRMCI